MLKNRGNHMPQDRHPKPTDAELAILMVLWEQGPSSVREVHNAHPRRHKAGYTTTLKQMQVMTVKGLLVREGVHGVHVYRPAVTERSMQRRLVLDLLGKAFGGSASSMIMQVLGATKTSREEAAEIRRLLDETKGRGK